MSSVNTEASDLAVSFVTVGQFPHFHPPGWSKWPGLLSLLSTKKETQQRFMNISNKTNSWYRFVKCGGEIDVFTQSPQSIHKRLSVTQIFKWIVSTSAFQIWYWPKHDLLGFHQERSRMEYYDWEYCLSILICTSCGTQQVANHNEWCVSVPFPPPLSLCHA